MLLKENKELRTENERVRSEANKIWEENFVLREQLKEFEQSMSYDEEEPEL